MTDVIETRKCRACHAVKPADEIVAIQDFRERRKFDLTTGMETAMRMQSFACRGQCEATIRAMIDEQALASLVDPTSLDDEFHKRFYEVSKHGASWAGTTWRGVPVLKNPLDLWIVQELIHEVKPRLIIETGTYRGGSALYYADLLDIVWRDDESPKYAMVLTVDLQERDPDEAHPRLTYFNGKSSVDPVVVEDARQMANHSGGPVMVFLDSNHSKEHVLEELKHYSPLVTPGSYLVVEDTNVHGHPVLPGHAPGPMEAVEEWLLTEQGSRFKQDWSRERYLMTFNPGGWLKALR